MTTALPFEPVKLRHIWFQPVKLRSIQNSLQFRQLKQWLIKMAVILMAFGSWSCEDLSSPVATSAPQTTRINSLEKRKSGARVCIKGTVEEQAPFIQSGAYQLADRSGSIWIFTTQPLPELGEEILICGQVGYENIVLEDLQERDVGGIYLKEYQKKSIPKQNGSEGITP